MKKYSFFVYEPEYESFLHTLKSLGVVHIKNNTDPEQIEHFKQIREQQSDLKHLKSRIEGIISNYPLDKDADSDLIPHPDKAESEVESFDSYIEAFDRLEKKLKETQKELDRIRIQRRELESWGDFDPTLLDKLRAHGHYIHFWTVLKNLYNNEWETLYNAQIIQEAGRSLYFVTIDRTEFAPELEYAEQISLPKGVSVSSLEIDEQRIQDEQKRLSDYLSYLAYHDSVLQEKIIELEDLYKLDNALFQGIRLYDNKLVVLEGWVPAPKVTALERSLSETGSVFEQMSFNPKEEDVPIELNIGILL